MNSISVLRDSHLFHSVKSFELDDKLLPNTFIVVRIDGRGFHKYSQLDAQLLFEYCRFTQKHEFEKPNDKNGLDLMNSAAKYVMNEIPEVILAYGQSDEFRLAFNYNTIIIIIVLFSNKMQEYINGEKGITYYSSNSD